MKASTSLFWARTSVTGLLEGVAPGRPGCCARPAGLGLVAPPGRDAARLLRCSCPAGRRFASFGSLKFGGAGFGEARPAWRPERSIASSASARLRQTVADRVPTLNGFPPLPVTPAAVKALIM